VRVTVVGGGMITHDQILPSLCQLQRLGRVSEIAVAAQHGRTLRALAAAFPSNRFQAWPELTADPEVAHPDLYRQAIGALPPRNLVVVALPDHLHFEAVMTALKHDQHVIVVKPLVLKVAEAETIEREARRRRLFVGIEYHKRFDDRSLLARSKYRAGAFGEFRLGTACLMEKWYYRHSNFQNWCTDAFTYIGCHYVDLVHFITGLLPVAVSVYGIQDRYPNGNEGFLWTDARVLWNNGACLNVQNSLSFPDAAPGTNTQGLTLYCSANGRGGLLRHSDQYRGLEYVYADQPAYAEPSPDYLQHTEFGVSGYGYRSIEFLLACANRVEQSTDRLQTLAEIDSEAIAATPANSRYNEQIIEAARQSIQNNGNLVHCQA
jgi:predicted dehydrogenase